MLLECAAVRAGLVYRSDYRTAARITRTGDALCTLSAFDHAMSTGALTLGQVAAAAELATPANDAELARIAVGNEPSAIAIAARTIVPPKVTDDTSCTSGAVSACRGHTGDASWSSVGVCRMHHAASRHRRGAA